MLPSQIQHVDQWNYSTIMSLAFPPGSQMKQQRNYGVPLATCHRHPAASSSSQWPSWTLCATCSAGWRSVGCSDQPRSGACCCNGPHRLTCIMKSLHLLKLKYVCVVVLFWSEIRPLWTLTHPQLQMYEHTHTHTHACNKSAVTENKFLVLHSSNNNWCKYKVYGASQTASSTWCTQWIK